MREVDYQIEHIFGGSHLDAKLVESYLTDRG
jgi:hypothetical protein